jgi:hypothetical protein
MLKIYVASFAVTFVLLASGAFSETPAEHAASLIRSHHNEVISLRAEGASVQSIREHRAAYEARLQPLVANLTAEEQAELKDLVLELTADRWTR